MIYLFIYHHVFQIYLNISWVCIVSEKKEKFWAIGYPPNGILKLKIQNCFKRYQDFFWPTIYINPISIPQKDAEENGVAEEAPAAAEAVAVKEEPAEEVGSYFF